MYKLYLFTKLGISILIPSNIFPVLIILLNLILSLCSAMCSHRIVLVAYTWPVNAMADHDLTDLLQSQHVHFPILSYILLIYTV